MRSFLSLFLVLITLVTCAQPGNDLFLNAYDVTGLINTCSANAAYTTTAATADQAMGSCWNNAGPLHNVWFKFTAPASGRINITVSRGGVLGTQGRTQLALWESDGTTQLACNRYVNDGDNVTVGSLSLIAGNTYYISVDVQSSGWRGSFTLCLQDNVDYDYYEGATDVSSLINSCSANAQYTTIGATADQLMGSCWNNAGPLYNRWFKFTAPASGRINITVSRGGALGTQGRTQLALWESDGTTQLACNRYVNDGDNVTVGSLSLIAGNTYYISVDVQSSGWRGSFTLCLQDNVDYDYYEGAMDVSSLINSCSANAQYTTIGATADKLMGSCWNNAGPLHNRWFKFTAPASGRINITVSRGGVLGTQGRTQLALWESDGTTQLACNRYVNDGDNVTIGSLSLIAGNTYYISVDVQSSGWRGSFTLCLQDNVDYDYYEGATDVSSLINSCSANAQYTTIGATADKLMGSCWNNAGPLYNRWFKFTAPASGRINITVSRGGVLGTQGRTQLALWESDGTTQLACNRYVNDGDNVTIGSLSLIAGNTYYISVDVQSSGWRGSFTLCLQDNVDYDYYEGATDVSSLINSCSANAQYTTIGATADKLMGSCWNNAGPLYNRWFKFTAPASGRINITVSRGGVLGTQGRTQLALWESDGTTQLACNRYVNDGDNVTIGSLSLIAGNTYYISVDVQSSGWRGSFTLCLQDNVDYDYYEGATDVSSLINSCSANAQYSTIGATADKLIGSCWNNAGPLYNRWFKFTAPASGQVNITVNRGGALGTQGRTQLALWEADGTTQLACNRYVNDGDNVTVGAASLVPGNTYYISVDAFSGWRGSFTLCLSDVVDYDYYDGAYDVSGIINSCSTPAQYSTMGATADKAAGSCWNNAGPLHNRWFKFVATTPGMLVTVDIGAGNGTQGRTQAAVWEANGTTLVGCARYTTDGSDVTVTTSGLVPGNTYYISVDVQSGGWRGSFTLCLDDYEPLPVEFASFSLVAAKNTVVVSWQTLSEENNRYFAVERSSDGNLWEEIATVAGQANSSERHFYEYVDIQPLTGTSYYRIKQYDQNEGFGFSEIHSISMLGFSNRCYPIPAQEYVILETNYQISALDVLVYNAQGQAVTEKCVISQYSENKVLIQCTDLLPGVYVLKTSSTRLSFIVGQ